jgi:hypothetical protein
MTRKDYELVAKIVGQRVRTPIRDRIAHDLSNAFEKDNKSFDRDKFLDAVGVKDKRYQ